MGTSWDFLAYHVHMTLEEDGLVVLIARTGWLIDQDIVNLIPQAGEMMLVRKIHQIIRALFFLEGCSGDFGEFFKILLV